MCWNHLLALLFFFLYVVHFSYTVFNEMVEPDSNAVLVLDNAPQAPVVQQAIDAHTNVLPDSRLKQPKNIYQHIGLNWVPIFCANCGAEGGFVPEENCDFAFYLCTPCAERLGPIAGTYMMPDEVFWGRVKQEQMEQFGRELTAPELIEILKDGSNSLTKLVNERRRR